MVIVLLALVPGDYTQCNVYSRVSQGQEDEIEEGNEGDEDREFNNEDLISVVLGFLLLNCRNSLFC